MGKRAKQRDKDQKGPAHLGPLRNLFAEDGFSPDDADSLAQRGAVYLREDRLEEALADLNRAIELDPDHGLALLLRGQIYLIQDQPQRALEDFHHAQELSLEPEALVQINIAEALQYLDRLDEALAAYDRVLALNPRFALADVKQVLRLEPDHAAATSLLKQLESAMGDRKV